MSKTLEEILKIVDKNGAKHGADGRFGSGGASKKTSTKDSKASEDDESTPKAVYWPSDSDIKSDAKTLEERMHPNGKEAWLKQKAEDEAAAKAEAQKKADKKAAALKKNPNLAYTSLPDGHKVRAEWGRDKTGPSAARIRSYDARGNATAQMLVKIDRDNGLAYVASYEDIDAIQPYKSMHHDPARIGACFAKLVEDVKKNCPEITRFSPPREPKLRDGESPESRRFKVANESYKASKEVFDKLFTEDGHPNDYFGKGTLASKATESDIAESVLLTKVPKPIREVAQQAVRDSINSTPFMPKKLALLTDAVVAGVSAASQKGALAWAMPTTRGSIVRLMPGKGWAALESARTLSHTECHVVAQQLPPEKRAHAVITHEMGHVLESSIKQIVAMHTNPVVTKAYQAMQLAYVESKVSTADQYASGSNRPSKYGRTNFAEYFAECYTAHRYGLYCPSAAEAFFEAIDTEKIAKLLRDIELYLLDRAPEGAEDYDCNVLDDHDANEKVDLRKFARIIATHNGVTRTFAKAAAAIRPGHAVTVNPHLDNTIVHPADAGRVLSVGTGDLGDRVVTYHSAGTGEAKTVPMVHARRMIDAGGSDEGNEHVSILPLHLGRKDGTSVIVHGGKIKGTLEPTADVGDITTHTVKNAMGEARAYEDRATAVAAIHAHFTPREAAPVGKSLGEVVGSA